MASLLLSSAPCPETQDELEALLSMFPDTFRMLEDHSLQFDIDDTLRLQIYIPSTYPTLVPPIFDLSLLHHDVCPSVELTKLVASAPAELLHLFQPNEPVIYEWYQFLSDKLSELDVSAVAAIKQEQQDNNHRLDQKDPQKLETESSSVILIDHFNNSSGYVRKLKKWTQELELRTDLWWATLTRCRREKIYVFVTGESTNFSIF